MATEDAQSRKHLLEDASMFILDMMRSGELHPMAIGLPLWQLMILVSIIVIAVKKNYNLWLAVIWGIIPFVSIFALIVYVGLPAKVKR
ncbi:hypothetical protein [Idiomarina loihiensis]|uniref:hypothetical protein n=1 Tax=Idiomarina loihiensis TaxID=135577 RepID=UPI00385136BB